MTSTPVAVTLALVVSGGITAGVTLLADGAHAAPADIAAKRPAPAPTPTPADATVAKLLAPRPAQLGPAFAGLTLGEAGASAPTLAQPAPPGVTIALAATGRRLDGVTITVPWDPGVAGCDTFTAALRARWGAGTHSDGHTTWRDAATEATFTAGVSDCTLRVVRDVAPEAWWNATSASRVPVWAIGHPASELAAALGVPRGDDEAELRWSDLSLGEPARAVELAAHVERGQVVGLTVHVPFDDSVGEVLWRRIKALYGAPDRLDSHEDSLQLRWRRAPGLTVSKYDGHDAFVPRPYPSRLDGQAPPPPMPAPRADDGVLVGVTIGR